MLPASNSVDVMGESSSAALSTTVWQDLDAAAADWRWLESRGAARHIFQTFLWTRAWWQNLGSGSPEILRIASGGNPVGLAPMIETDGVLTLLGDKEVCDYLDILSLPGSEPVVVEALLDYCRGRALDLPALRPDSLVRRFLIPTAANRGYRTQSEAIDVTFDLPLPASWEGYLEVLKSKDRHELRRKLRNLYSAGKIEYYSAAPSATDMDDFLRLFRISREDKQAFMTPEREAFFRQLARDLGDEGRVKLSFLEIDRKRVAAAFCFDYGNAISLYNSGYDPDYAPLSVGLLCKAMTIKEAIEKGRTLYDFLRGAEDYKFHLGGKPVPVYRVEVRP